MQYYYEHDLYTIDSELTEVAKKIITVTDSNSEIFHTDTTTTTTNLLTTRDVYNMSNHPHNHAFLHQLITQSSTISRFLNWQIISQITTDIKLLRDNFDCINWNYLSSNPNALELLQENPHLIDWDELSTNPGAIPIIEKYFDKINIDFLCCNPNAIHLLERAHPKDLNFYNLAKNINAFPIIKQHLEYILENPRPTDISYRCSYHDLAYLWNLIAEHPSQEAAIFIMDNMWEGVTDYGVQSLWLDGMKTISKHIWCSLSNNKYAVKFLEKHRERIYWNQLCYNVNAIELLDDELKKQNVNAWRMLDAIKMNPNAGSLVTKYMTCGKGPDWIERITSLVSTPTKWAMDLVDECLSVTPATELTSSWTSPNGIAWSLLSANQAANMYGLHLKYARHLNRLTFFNSNNVSTKKYIYNYNKMRELKRDLHSQLIAVMHHPRNIIHIALHLGFNDSIPISLLDVVSSP
jgi:AraC-like DNA-binding protein